MAQPTKIRPTHPLAGIFPLMNEEGLKRLTADIKKNGLLQPIVLYEDKILDGRNRWRACLKAKVKLKFTTYEGDDPLGFVISSNLQRRQLSESGRGMSAARVATLSAGNPANRPIGLLTQDEAAALFNVGVRTIKRARKVLESGNAKLIKAVDDDVIAVSVAARLATKPEEEANEIVELVQSGDKPQNAMRKVKTKKGSSQKLSGKYRVLYADPPWLYSDKLAISSESGGESYGPAEAHYPSMSITELCALPIKEITEDNAVLFLWVTSPLLEDSFAVIAAWGFEYKASFVWDKVKHNMGHYNSVRHEFLLVATRGSCVPDNRKLFDSVQVIERNPKHSAKPKEFREIIDTLYTHGNKIELFARETVKGWKRWGNE